MIILIAIALLLGTQISASEGTPDLDFRSLSRNLIDPERQMEAVAIVSHLHVEAAASFASLLNAQSEDELVRAGAATALGICGEPAHRFVPDLARALNNKSLTIAQSAAGALAELVTPSDAAVVPQLVTRLMNRPPVCGFECFWSIQALGRIGPNAKAAVPVLQSIAKDRRQGSAMQGEAHSAINKIRGPIRAPQ